METIGMAPPTATLAPGEAELSFPERRARRGRVVRSSCNGCRMILRCAKGSPNKEAVELGVHGQTVDKWFRRFLNNASTGYRTGPGPDARGPSGTAGSRTSSGRHPTSPIGRPARWPGGVAFHIPRSGASGPPSGCCHIVRETSGPRAVPRSRTRSATPWACIRGRRTSADAARL